MRTVRLRRDLSEGPCFCSLSVLVREEAFRGKTWPVRAPEAQWRVSTMPLLCFAVVKEERSTRSVLAYVPCPEERATPLSVVPPYQL